MPTHTASSSETTGDVTARLTRELNHVLFPFRTGVTNMVLATYFRSLAQCVDSGVSLQQALGSLELSTGMKAELVHTTQSIKSSISRGTTFVEAASAHPDVFSPLAVGLIEVGENIGSLGDNLRKLAEIHEMRHRMIQEVIRRVMYPLGLVLVAAYILPVPIMMVKGVGGYISAIVPRTCFFILCVLLVMFGPAAGKAILGRASTHSFLMKLPLFGHVVKLYALDRFSRAMGMSISAGVEVGKSLQLALRATDNAVIENRIQSQLPVIQRYGLAKGLAEAGVYQAEHIGVIEVGEQTGNMGTNLVQVADRCNQRASEILATSGRILAGALFMIVVVISMLSVFSTMMSNMGGLRERLLEQIQVTPLP